MIFGPWEKFAEGYGKMVLGYFGKTPVEPDSEIIELAAKKMNLQPTKENPVDLNDADPKKGIDAATKLLIDNELDVTDENIFIAAACKQKGIDFLLGKVEINGVRKHSLMPKEAEAGGDGTYSVSIDNKIYNVKINGDEAIVNGQSFNISVNDGDVEDSSNNSNSNSEGSEIVSPMNAKVISVNLNVGDVVNEGDIVFIVEAMKMEVEVKAASSGKISSIDAKAGDQVSSGDKMATIN